MKQSSTLFLKIVIILIVVATIAGMIWFPQAEGRARDFDLISTYANPFIIYMYIASIPFFFGLFQAFKLLTFIDSNKAFSKGAINTFKNMKYASLILIGFIFSGLLYIRFFANGEDPAGPTMFGLILSLVFGVIATAAGILQKLFQNAVDIKSENDLTV